MSDSKAGGASRSDIVERLRAWEGDRYELATVLEAADEIERLRKECDDLRRLLDSVPGRIHDYMTRGN